MVGNSDIRIGHDNGLKHRHIEEKFIYSSCRIKEVGDNSKAGIIHYTFIHWTQTWQCSAMRNFCNQIEDKTNRKHEAVTKSFYYLWIRGTAMRFIWQKDCYSKLCHGVFFIGKHYFSSTFLSSVLTNLEFHIRVITHTDTRKHTHSLHQNYMQSSKWYAF